MHSSLHRSSSDNASLTRINSTRGTVHGALTQSPPSESLVGVFHLWELTKAPARTRRFWHRIRSPSDGKAGTKSSGEPSENKGGGASDPGRSLDDEDRKLDESSPELPLLLCSTCPASFHLPCLRPRLRAMPKGAWSCAYCFATGRAKGGDSDGACGAVRLMESLRRGMQGAIRVSHIWHTPPGWDQ